MAGIGRGLLKMRDSSREIFIARQPILDRAQKLVAYELLFRSGHRNAADVDDHREATASVITRAFVDLGIEAALGPYKGYINCDESLLLSDMLEVLPPDKIVLEVLETVAVTPAIVARCLELKSLGYVLALDDFVADHERLRPLLAIVDIVKVDTMLLNAEELLEATRLLKKWPVRLLAERVDSQETAAQCHADGYALFQGYYFAHPAIIAGKKLGHSQLALLNLLDMVVKDAETEELEAVFKQEPGLAVNLLRLTNSLGSGVRTRITSLRHAISVLGRRQLHRWLQLLMYTAPAASAAAGPLMQLAATRGRLMELLAARVMPGDRGGEDHAFMCGILSLMPALMGVAMEDILSTVSVGQELTAALQMGAGTLGTMMALTVALEGNDGEACHNFTAKLSGLDADIVNACHTQALVWANNIERET